MRVFKYMISRNWVLFVAIGLILTFTVDWQKCFIQRGKYLLGIFYNGYFQNQKDGEVYTDYLKRHGSTPEQFKGLI